MLLSDFALLRPAHLVCELNSDPRMRLTRAPAICPFSTELSPPFFTFFHHLSGAVTTLWSPSFGSLQPLPHVKGARLIIFLSHATVCVTADAMLTPPFPGCCYHDTVPKEQSPACEELSAHLPSCYLFFFSLV